MIVPDSSVLVAGFAPDHPSHDTALTELARAGDDLRLVTHTMAETFSVLSSPRGVFRADSEPVVTYLDTLLARSTPVTMRPDTYREALAVLVREERGGALVYDALIAITARNAGATLISLDRRAKPTYELCGVDARFLDAA